MFDVPALLHRFAPPKTRRSLIYKLGYALAAILVVCSLCYGSSNHPLRSDILFAAALVILIVSFSAFYRAHRKDRSKLIQLCLCYVPFALFWSLSIVSPYSSKNVLLVVLLGVLAFVSPALMLVVSLARSISWSHLRDLLVRHCGIFLVIGIFVVLSFDVLPRTAVCDSFLYFDASAKAVCWDFTLKDPELFKFCSHQSYSVALWYMIGGFLLPLDPAGQRLMNILLISIAIFCFYTVVLKLGFFKRRHTVYAAVSTALFAFNPLILGIIFEIDLDIPSVAFYAWLIASYLYRKNILFIYSAFSLALCKEIGIVLLFGFGMGWLIELLFKARKNGFNPLVSIRQQLIIPITLITSSASFLVLYMMTPRWMSGSEKAEIAKEAGMNIFTLNYDNIIMKLKEMFILNFSWLLVVVICIAFLVWILRKASSAPLPSHASSQKCVHVEQCREQFCVGPIVGSYIVFVAFNLVYLTYLNPRYVICHVMGLTLLAVYSLSYILRQRNALYCTCSVLLAALMLVQTFATVDPATLRFFKNIDIGKSTIITTRVFFQSADGRTTDPYLASSRELMHGASYNRQYCYVGSVFETVLRDIDYSSNTMVIVDPIYDKLGTYIAFFGKWGADEDEYYYNPNTGRVQQLAGPEKLNVVVSSENAQIDLDAYQDYARVYFVSASFRAEFETCQPIDGLPVLDSGTSDYRLWEMNYYRLK